MDEQQVRAEFAASVAELSSRHVTVSYLAVTVLALALGGGGWLLYHAMQSYDKAMGAAQEREAVFQKHLETDNEVLHADNLRLQDLAAQVAAAQNRVVYRDKQSVATITQVKAPDRPVPMVAKDVETYLKVTPVITPDNLLAFQPPTVQDIVATRIERDTLRDDVNDYKVTVSSYSTQVALLGKDLAMATENVAQCQGVVKSYKAIAVKSKWRRVLDVAEKVGIAVVGVAIGRAI